MPDPKRTTNDRSRVFVYRGTLPPALLLLLVAPLLLVFLSVAAVALAGGAVAALFLPIFLRGRRVRRAENDCLILDPDQYSRVEPDAPKLPRP